MSQKAPSFRRARKMLLGSSAVALAMFATSAINAQDADTGEEVEDEVEEVVVTGSRLRKNSFTSTSPMQVISGEVSRELGLFDATDVLQQTTQSTGLQINNTFNNFVLDNGVGASTISFRGLGADRTLVLINGRRFAPAGVGGGPSAPDVNLIPSVLVASYENLFDGAAAVYGSDAVAGVSNVILRTGVEGIEAEASYSMPESGGGEEMTVGVLWGDRGDRWNFTVAAEYYDRKSQSFAENDFFNSCDEYLFETESGRILTENRSGTSGSTVPGNGSTTCPTSAYNRIIEGSGFLGSIYYTPGTTNMNALNWSETTLSAGLAGFIDQSTALYYDTDGDGVVDRAAIDGDGDGAVDVKFTDPRYNYNLTDEAFSGDLLASLKRYSIFADGAYILNEETDLEAYAEFSYTKRESDVFIPGSQQFPVVPASNPFNPFGEGGYDAWSIFPAFDFGTPVTAQPVVLLRGDRDSQNAEVEQYRSVFGLRGNIPAMDNFLGGNWAFDIYGSYSRSNGDEVTTGIHADRRALSLNTTIEDPNNPGSYICGADGNGDGIPDGTDGCVPVNFFADSIYQTGGGTFATQAEADYLFVDRTFRTEIEQTVINGIVTGDLFSLPWNDEAIPFLLGGEYRKDKIASNGNNVANEGLLAHWFSDQGAEGSREFYEVFAEAGLILLQDKPGIQEMGIDLSARVTDESNFKPAFTYSVKGYVNINEYLTLRGTYGTSFRAPNLRERFLRGTTGFSSVTDPCVVPTDARTSDPSSGDISQTYDPSGDDRDPNVIAACTGNGLDPLSLGLDDGTGNAFNPLTNTESSTGGSLTVDEETSTSYTMGVTFSQPFSDSFDLQFSVTYFNIEIEGGVNEPSNAFILNQCYDNPDAPGGDSAFCGKISRDSDGQIDFIRREFENFGLETSKGIDFNVLYEQDFELGSDALSVTLDARATKASEVFSSLLGVEDDDVGEVATPSWRAQATLFLGYKDFGFAWNTRWIQGGVEDDRSDFDYYTPCPDETSFTCRPISATTNYNVHNASFTYTLNEDFTFNVGVRNIFHKAPPKVDSTDVFSVNLNPIGVGYDNVGRTFFGSVRAKF
jgi:iron complex outermembrane receptor protein